MVELVVLFELLLAVIVGVIVLWKFFSVECLGHLSRSDCFSILCVSDLNIYLKRIRVDVIFIYTTREVYLVN